MLTNNTPENRDRDDLARLAGEADRLAYLLPGYSAPTKVERDPNPYASAGTKPGGYLYTFQGENVLRDWWEKYIHPVITATKDDWINRGAPDSGDDWSSKLAPAIFAVAGAAAGATVGGPIGAAIGGIAPSLFLAGDGSTKDKDEAARRKNAADQKGFEQYFQSLFGSNSMGNDPSQRALDYQSQNSSSGSIIPILAIVLAIFLFLKLKG